MQSRRMRRVEEYGEESHCNLIFATIGHAVAKHVNVQWTAFNPSGLGKELESIPNDPEKYAGMFKHVVSYSNVLVSVCLVNPKTLI
jgi:hypothetical protein